MTARIPINKQLEVLYNTPDDIRGLNEMCLKILGKTLGYGNIIYIQDPGEKKQGYIYLDRNKEGLFYCTTTSSTTSNEASVFTDYSNLAIGNKLENLPSFSVFNPPDQSGISIATYKINKIGFACVSKYSDARNYVKLNNVFKNIKCVQITPHQDTGNNSNIVMIQHFQDIIDNTTILFHTLNLTRNGSFISFKRSETISNEGGFGSCKIFVIGELI